MNEDFNRFNIFFVWDCEIDYIDDDDYYERFYTSIVLTNWHLDGLDIWLGPDNHLDGFGYSVGGIPGRGIFVGGSYWEEPFNPLVRSRVISHEMGHCLGLHHTFLGAPNSGLSGAGICEEYIDNSNCQTCGDFVCDTPPDPLTQGANGSVPYPECKWMGNLTDSNGHYYDPDETNIMSYTHPKCMVEFTEGQGARMRLVIPLTSYLLQRLVPADLTSQVINTNTTWTTSNTPNNGDFTVFDDIVVESGSTLTISAGVTIHFGPESKLIIKPNAKVISYGVLTGLGCRGYTWEGVKVYGSTSAYSQYTISGSVAQGRFEGRPGSEIRHAKVGIQLYGPTWALAGGQVSLSGSVIKNCKIGVEFAPYRNFYPHASPSSQTGQPRDYNVSFNKVEFVNDNEFAHDNFIAFMHMTGVNRINMYGCTMSNGTSIKSGDMSAWGYGIFANDAGFTVAAFCEDDPPPSPGNCEEFTYPSFSGLAYGVYAARIVTNRPYTVKNAIFQNCYIGVNNRSVSGSTLLFNKFEMGELPSTDPTNEQIGVFYETDVAGLTCEENEFYDTNLSELYTTIGIMCSNTGYANKVIRKNTFENLNCHNVANAVNASTRATLQDRGLYYDCNLNFDVIAKDFNVPDPGGNIRRIQGLIVNSSSAPSAAGNRFSYTQVDFENLGASIDYYYYPSGTNQTPVWINGNISTITADQNSCPTTYCDPPCKTELEILSLKGDYFAGKSDFNTALSNYISSPTTPLAREVAYLTQKTDQTSNLVLLHSQMDTLTFSQDSVLTWIQHLESFEGDLWYVNELVGNGSTASALTALTNVITEYGLTGSDSLDINRYKSIVSLLDGQDIYSLDDTTVGAIKDYVGLGGFSEAWAKRITTPYGYHFEPEYMTCQDLERPGTTSNLQNEKVLEEVYITVSPNPASDEVFFNISIAQEPQDITLTIYDINGKVVHQKKQLINSKSYRWDSSIHNSGVYLYQVYANGKQVFSGKVILQK